MNENTDGIHDRVASEREPQAVASSYHDSGPGESIVPQAGCSTCGSTGMTADPGSANAARMPAYVYAVGKVDTRFPSLGVEKEFAQAIKRVDTAGKTRSAEPSRGLSQRENRIWCVSSVGS